MGVEMTKPLVIMPCMDMIAGRVVKGVRFVDIKDAGDPVECCRAYCDAGADEIAMLDITATIESRATLLDVARRVAEVASQLSTEKYRLTIQAFENAMTTKASWLVTQVPRAILGYAERRMQDRYETLRRELPEAETEQRETAILQEMVKIQSAQRRIKQKMGREKNTK